MPMKDRGFFFKVCFPEAMPVTWAKETSNSRELQNTRWDETKLALLQFV